MSLRPYTGGGGGGGGGTDALLHKAITIFVAAIFFAAVINGGTLESLAQGLLGTLNHAIRAVQIVVGSAATLVVVCGGAMAMSPWHRRLGYELVIGGLVGLVLVFFAPTVVGDVQKSLPSVKVSVVVQIPPSSRGAL